MEEILIKFNVIASVMTVLNVQLVSLVAYGVELVSKLIITDFIGPKINNIFTGLFTW